MIYFVNLFWKVNFLNKIFLSKWEIQCPYPKFNANFEPMFSIHRKISNQFASSWTSFSFGFKYNIPPFPAVSRTASTSSRSQLLQKSCGHRFCLQSSYVNLILVERLAIRFSAKFSACKIVSSEDWVHLCRHCLSRHPTVNSSQPNISGP